MSARKWPIYTMQAGKVETLAKLSAEDKQRLWTRIHVHSAETGKKFETKTRGDDFEIRRVS